jgi:hypothetical protein
VEIQALKNIIEMCKSLDLVKNIDDKPQPFNIEPEVLKNIRRIYGFD